VLVVAGCGAAGAEFVRHFGGDVTVVSPSPLLVCQALLPAYVAGNVEEEELSINLKPFFRERGVVYRRGEVKFIKLKCNTLFSNYRTLRGISYDFAVIAVGGESCYYGVDCRNCLSVNTLEDARVARERVSAGGKVVVVGSGMTGVETAYELSDLCRVTLVEAQSRILPAMGEKASVYVRKLLERKGVKVLTSCRVEDVSYEESVVKSSCGELGFDEVVWCAGIRGREISGLDYGKLGIKVDESLRAYENVFAIGDCAEVVVKGEVATKTALEAERQAKFVAKTISRMLKSEKIGLNTYVPFSTNKRPFAILTFGEKGLIVRGNTVIASPSNLIYKLKRMIVKRFLKNFIV